MVRMEVFVVTLGCCAGIYCCFYCSFIPCLLDNTCARFRPGQRGRIFSWCDRWLGVRGTKVISNNDPMCSISITLNKLRIFTLLRYIVPKFYLAHFQPSQAKEIYQAGNQWLTYSKSLHLIREAGISIRLFDLLDEKVFYNYILFFLCFLLTYHIYTQRNVYK